jgi:protein PhnA
MMLPRAMKSGILLVTCVSLKLPRLVAFSLSREATKVRGVQPLNLQASWSRRTTPSSISTRLFSGIPEPGSCPECSDENTYWDGSGLFVCTNCSHEWTAIAATDGGDGASQETDEDDVTRDVNGNILESGVTCVLIKDLAKGKLKKGLKVKIRLGDYGDGHDCEATISGVGTYALKSQFLKKV